MRMLVLIGAMAPGLVLIATSTAPAASCISNASCPGDYYCAKQEGDCAGPGTCTRRPDMCPFVYNPVCGCDGKTYGNPCEATRAGVNVLYRGLCQAQSCSNNDDCGASHYCAKADGDCYGQGACAESPVSCPEIWEPVCGCDGVSYYNSCFAAMAGVSIKHEGLCSSPSVCMSNGSCSAGHYCAKADGDCGGTGNCRQRPEICFDVWDPVCGCDGATYGNACEAAVAGASVDYQGVCLSVGPVIIMRDPHVGDDDVHSGPSGLNQVRILWSEPVEFDLYDIVIVDERNTPIQFSVAGSGSAIMTIRFTRRLIHNRYAITITDSVHSSATGYPIDGDNDGSAGGHAVIIMEHRMRNDFDNNNRIDFRDLALFADTWLTEV